MFGAPKKLYLTSQEYEKKNWEASLVLDLFISVQVVQIFSSVLQKGEVKLEKSAITLKYAIDAEKISWYGGRVMPFL